jgi:hypothetical protein
MSFFFFESPFTFTSSEWYLPFRIIDQNTVLKFHEWFENVEKFKYLGTALTDQNDIRDEIKSRLNSGNTSCYSVQNLLSSHLISKNLKIKIDKTVILPGVLYWCETWSFTLGEEQRLRFFENSAEEDIWT